MSETVNLLQVPLQSNGGGALLSVILLVFLLAVIGLSLITIAGMWVAFKKAGQPGWAAIIPLYNAYIMLKIGNNEWWWLLALFVPLVNLYALYKIFNGVSNAFGQGIGFTLGLMFLSFVFWPLLGFGDYSHRSAPRHGVRPNV